MRKDYTFYNCYCHDDKQINFKTYVLDELRRLGYFHWLRDEPMGLTDEKYFLNSTQRIPYIEREIKTYQDRIRNAKKLLKQIEEHSDEEYAKYVKDETEKWQEPHFLLP